MLTYFLDSTQVGLYSVASKLMIQAIFLGHVFVLTFYPRLQKLMKSADKNYLDFIQGLVNMLILLALSLAIFVFIFADIIVISIFGPEFAKSAFYLRILVWSWIFIFPSALYTRLLILNNNTNFEFYKSILAASLCLILNFLMIPIYGPIAAAAVSLLTYFIADWLFFAVSVKTRPMFMYSISAGCMLIAQPRKFFYLIKNVASSN